MNIEQFCEICGATENLALFELAPTTKTTRENSLTMCTICMTQAKAHAQLNTDHFQCLSSSMWSEQRAVQIMSYRLLHRLKRHAWAQDLLDQLYLNDDALELAKLDLRVDEDESSGQATVDSNGVPLSDGDSVTLIKDLDVKGAGFTAKRGTLVKNITLTNNPEHIEGKVNGIGIVLLAKYLKKA